MNGNRKREIARKIYIIEKEVKEDSIDKQEAFDKIEALVSNLSVSEMIELDDFIQTKYFDI